MTKLAAKEIGLTVLRLPKAIQEAAVLFRKNKRVSPPVEHLPEDVSAFDIPKGIDVSTEEGRAALKGYHRVKIRRAGLRTFPGVHIEPGTLGSLLGSVTVGKTGELPNKPPFLKDYTKRRVKGRDSVERGVQSARVLIDETARLDDMFRYTDHTVTMEERQAMARQKIEELDGQIGAVVKWDSSEPADSTSVKWE